MKKESTPDNVQSNSFRFLPNKAIGEDLFKNKSQKRIANVISEKIINEPGFKVIGIDGTWGSGKSNLVQLIEKELDKTHKFFIYDVWGHQEDDQRHSILTEITDFISDHESNLVEDKNKWEKRLNSLISKQRNITTTNIPHLSIGFIISLLLIIYIPTVNTFAKDLSFYWKIALVLLPILVLFILFTSYYYKIRKIHIEKDQKKLKMIYRFKKYALEAAQNLFKVYNNQKVDETKIEIISEKEPTVKEFRDWMCEIDKDLKTKIVIVFDNFDRLPKKHILSVWSSIHIFFAEKEYKNIKVILPFDRDHVQNAFKELNRDSDDKTFADDYVNKTFDIVFRISLPIMSDWKQFFREQWRKAHTQVDEIELEKVIQVYEFLNRRITPREIIVFINEILTIKHLDDDLKERYISIFILCKDHILADSLNAIIELNYLNGLETLYSNDEEYAKQITSIVFHIPVEEATELIYTEQLKQSLNKKDIKQFNNICKTAFINDIFFGAINGLEELSNPILTLSELAQDSELSEHNLEEAWNTFYSKTLSKEIKIADLKVEEWQLVLLNNSTDSRFLNNLLNRYSSMVANFEIDEYLNLLDVLFENLEKENVLSKLNVVMVAPEKLLKIIELKDKDFSDYKCDCKTEELDEHLAKLTIENILKIKQTSILTSSYELPKYKKVLLENTVEFANQNNIQKFDNILTKLKETVNQNDDLKDCITDDQIYNLYSSHHQQKPQLPVINELIAMRIGRGNNFSQSYVSQFDSILKSDNEDLADKISKTILNYIRYDDLLLSADVFKDSVLYRNVIKLLMNDNEVTKDSDNHKLFNNYQTIKNSLNIENNMLLVELDNWEVDFEELEIETLEDDFVFDCFDNMDLDVSKGFINEFNKFYEFDEESYQKIFGNESGFYFRHFDKLEDSSLNQTSLNVFKTSFINYLKENAIISDLWRKAFIKYEKNNTRLSIQNLLKDLRDEVLNSGIDFNVEKALFLIPYFLKYKLLEGSNDLFRKLFKVDFFANNDYVNLLVENSDQIKGIYKSANTDDKSDFRNTINERREEGNQYDKIAKLLDIRKSKEDKKEE
ncbi:P-loop NTPase fold protein [Aequorivita sinensis]|uniref:P-loop NTPase fold protein n=1 Tax=Aequorivita sinensis TaxID=1382458 RepID=UPI00230016EC|nr:P-loop NTPase fold protein [Aequorivita sinensis]